MAFEENEDKDNNDKIVSDAIREISQSIKENSNQIQKSNTDDDFDAFDEEVKCKKYVITVEVENIENFDKYTPEKRNKIINDFLRNYEKEQKVANIIDKIKIYLTQIVTVFITVIIFTPIIFWGTSKSIELTRKNIRNVQYNFEQLYNQKGGIKTKDISQLRKMYYK